jgi:hypothetical protein
MDPAVRKETGYIALWVIALSLVMEGVFLLLQALGVCDWDLSVLFGNLGGAAVAVGNFFLMAVTVSRAVASGKPEQAARKVKATVPLRLAGCALICVILIAVFKTNLFATVIPLLFPRIGIAFRPFIDRKRGVNPPETEEGELLD